MAAAKPAKKKRRKLSLASHFNLLLYKVTLGTASRIVPPRPRRPELTSQSRVLVFSSAGLGDSLLDSVAFRALEETFPGIHMEAVVHHRRPDISRHNPWIKQLHYLRKGPVAFVKLLAELRRCGPWDAILYLSCLDPEARSLGYLLNRDVTIGLAWRTEMASLCAWNLDEPGLQRAHLADQALRVVAQAGAQTAFPRMVYVVSDEDRAALDGRLTALGFPLKPAVTFQLGGGGSAYRDWPAEHFVALAKDLHARGIGPLFLLGGPDHRVKAEKVVALADGVPLFNATAKLPLPQSAALVERSRCLVSTDTGIMHLGFAVGTPTVALLHCQPGQARVGPQAEKEKHEVIQLARTPGYKKPEDAVMSAILPGEVAAAVLRILERGVAPLDA